MRRSEAGTIEQARLFHTQTSTEGTYPQHSTISKQKRYPTKTDTRQHLKQFYLVGQAPPTDIYTKPKEKGSRDFPERVESLRRGAPTSSCRASLAPCARQFGRGFWGSHTSCAAISVRTGSGSAGALLRVTLGKTLSCFMQKNTRTDNRNPDLSLSESKRPSLTP